jgi:hypothetical protein
MAGPTEQEVREQNSRLPRGAARFNVHPFTCPGCHRHFAPGHCKIMFVYGRAHCQHCYDYSMKRTQGVAGTRITPTEEQRAMLCATCKRPFGTRRIVVNTNGHLVHYRCPSAKNP